METKFVMYKNPPGGWLGYVEHGDWIVFIGLEGHPVRFLRSELSDNPQPPQAEAA